MEILVLHNNTWNNLTVSNEWIVLNRIISVE